jgi:hypothetical protein
VLVKNELKKERKNEGLLSKRTLIVFFHKKPELNEN